MDRGLSARHGQALVAGALAGLLRPEAWIFLLAYGVWLWRAEPSCLSPGCSQHPRSFWLPGTCREPRGSGDLLRSQERARIPNPGAPATKDAPALASLASSAGIAFVPLLAGLLLLRGRALALAAAAAGWVTLVAVMAERGYSGEPRYALPGVAALAVAGAAGLARVPLRALLVLALVALPFGAARLGSIAGELERAADDAELYGSLDDAVAAAGGRDAVLRCGRPVVGRLRGPALAWALDVHKSEVGFDAAAGGPIFHSRIRRDAQVMPAVDPRSRTLGRSARWRVTCTAGAATFAAQRGKTR